MRAPLPPVEELRAAVAEHGSAAAAARALGVGHDSVGRALRRAERDTGAYEMPAGHVIKGESALINGSGEVVARWIKTAQGNDTAALVEGLQAAFERFAGAAPAVPAPAVTDDDLLTVYPIADLHFGMYSWAPETGADYDVEIATRLATETLADLIAQSRPSRRCVLLGLGDYFHANDGTNETPRSRHRLDVDGRHDKVYEAGAWLMVGLIDQALRKHELVDVVMLPGNHDPEAAKTLRVALAMYYRAEPRVRVYKQPGIHWYLHFGRVLMGATHGHTMKADRMAMMLATDQREAWGLSDHYFVWSGHIHHETVKEVGPVRVESFGTIAPKDAYAAEGGWRSARGMQALTIHRTRGEIGRHRVNITTARAA